MNFADLPNTIILDITGPYLFLCKNLEKDDLFCLDTSSVLDSIFSVLFDVENVDENITEYLDWLIAQGLEVKSDVQHEQIVYVIDIIDQTIRKILDILNTLGYGSNKEFPYMFRSIRNNGTITLSKIPSTQLL